ncbi:MAG: cysteine desulfurase family protein [Candidatus Bathyarchaeia archaeon]
MKAYMDHGSSRPVDSRVLEEMRPYFTEDFGNPASLHSYGFMALEALKKARQRVADLVEAEPEEIIFTSGATESNNLALLGGVERYRGRGDGIVISAVEHISVINIAKELSKKGFRVETCPVDGYGRIRLEELEDLVDDQTVIVSLMAANGEVGTIQPIKRAAEIAHEHDALFHTDATAANGQIPLEVGDEIDLMTLSSNDMYGPRGTGALYMRRGSRVNPQMIGGGQESGMRSGSENIPGTVGMGKAAQIAGEEMEEEAKRLKGLRDLLVGGILDEVPAAFLNGHSEERLPNNANLRFSYLEGESITLRLDDLGIQVSTGSACAAKTLEPSHVCLAMGLTHEEAHGTIVFTLGKDNNRRQVEYVLEQIPKVIRSLRGMSPLTPEELR